MKAGALYRTNSNICLIANVKKTSTILERMRGLLARPQLQADEGLLIAPCPSIHTFGMHYALDIVFLDSTGRVLKLVQSLPPWCMAACSNAYATLELSPGTLTGSEIQLNDMLEWREK